MADSREKRRLAHPLIPPVWKIRVYRNAIMFHLREADHLLANLSAPNLHPV